jgi:hypothetical protein
MTNQEILKKAIEKAVSNSYIDWGVPEGSAAYSVIFSHDFAKAFWGEEFKEGEAESSNEKWVSGYEWEFKGKRWQWHLQQMVLEEEPLKYLERFI